ncbi:hypothetical protein NTGHW29_590001 [Candidatus Nitrotoga sp. HW29]|nr:hypothetical protein NTGHW29_590001 [Candidatus Nitrotoga sp. HW29]
MDRDKQPHYVLQKFLQYVDSEQSSRKFMKHSIYPKPTENINHDNYLIPTTKQHSDQTKQS